MRPLTTLLMIISFLLTSFMSPGKLYAQEGLNLPAPGTMVNLSPAYEPILIKGLTIHKDNPFLFDFILDSGDSKISSKSPEFKAQADKLVKYFFACLTIPEKDLWVNLSPYEKQRIIPAALGQTALGMDLLSEDYILKQLTASLIYPEKNLGKEFWDRVYAKARQTYGTTQIPVNTFNKVWIMADSATVYEYANSGFIAEGHLKVMLEEDYLALEKHVLPSHIQRNDAHSIGSEIVRQIILPEIEKEVNTGRNFSALRQIFHSLILASWYKKALKEALLNQVYANKSLIKGINFNDPMVKEGIYQQYIEAYKKGVFNYIKNDPALDGQTIPRKYFSGGFLVNPAMINRVKKTKRSWFEWLMNQFGYKKELSTVEVNTAFEKENFIPPTSARFGSSRSSSKSSVLPSFDTTKLIYTPLYSVELDSRSRYLSNSNPIMITVPLQIKGLVLVYDIGGVNFGFYRNSDGKLEFFHENNGDLITHSVIAGEEEPVDKIDSDGQLKVAFTIKKSGIKNVDFEIKMGPDFKEQIPYSIAFGIRKSELHDLRAHDLQISDQASAEGVVRIPLVKLMNGDLEPTELSGGRVVSYSLIKHKLTPEDLQKAVLEHMPEDIPDNHPVRIKGHDAVDEDDAGHHTLDNHDIDHHDGIDHHFIDFHDIKDLPLSEDLDVIKSVLQRLATPDNFFEPILDTDHYITPVYRKFNLSFGSNLPSELKKHWQKAVDSAIKMSLEDEMLWVNVKSNNPVKISLVEEERDSSKKDKRDSIFITPNARPGRADNLKGVPKLPKSGTPFILPRDNNSQAMLTPTNGGIDLNTSRMGFFIKKEAGGDIQVDLDPAMVSRIKKYGLHSLQPIIISITPVTDTRTLLN